MPPAIDRCPWAVGTEDIAYHDEEWGLPVHDDRVFFEFLILEGAQAGLSWSTILNKRAGYSSAFSGVEQAKVSRFAPSDIARLMNNAEIVRNRLKIESAVANAKAFLEVQREFGSFDHYVWAFVRGTTLQHRHR